MRKQLWTAALAVATALTLTPNRGAAQDVDCGNEFRSGKLYFNQYQESKREDGGDRARLSEATRTLLDKSVEHFAITVEHCPLDKAEYRWNNAIALGEAGLVAYAEAAMAGDTPARDDKLKRGLEMITQAKLEFDAVPDTEDGHKKKQIKKVRENRRYFWNELYIQGLRAAQNENLVVASEALAAAIVMNPLDARAYHQGAVISFNAGLRHEAADMVQRALAMEIDPGNTAMADTLEAHRPALEELQLAFFNELGRETLNQAKDEDDLEKFKQALDYYDALVESDPENPNHRYGRGVAHMTGGQLYRNVDSTKSVHHYAAAGEDLEKAADIVGLDQDAGFHTSAVKAAMFAWRDAGDTEKALVLNKQYACLDPLSESAWRGLARMYVDAGNQDEAIGALMMSKSLAGTDVPVGITVENATDDAAAAVQELGNPSTVKSYLDGEKTITTFIWEDHNLARLYLLGKLQQEVTWCD